MRNRRRIRKTAAAVAVMSVLMMWASPAAALDGDSTESPVTDLQQEPDGDVRVQTTLGFGASRDEINAVFDAVQDAMQNDPDVRNNPCAAVTVVTEGGGTIGRPGGCNEAGARPTGTPCTNSAGQTGVMGPYNGRFYPCIVTPPTPSPPGWTLMPFTVTCEATAFVVESPAHGYAITTRRTQHEVEWRTVGDTDWLPLGYSSDVMVRLEGEPVGGETIEARVRGRASQRTLSSGRYSPWSAYGAWTAWTEGTAPAPCPTPEPAPVDLDACRDGTSVRVWWTARLPLDPSTLPLAGWQVETTDRTVTLTDNLNADARSVEPALLFTGTAWDVTVWALVGPGSGVLGSVPTTMQVTSSTAMCPSTPVVPIAPTVFDDPSPALVCGPAVFGAIWPGWVLWEPADWEREEEFEAEFADSGGMWQPLSETVDRFGRWSVEGPSDPGDTVQLRVRGRGRHRQWDGGLWSPWSAWSAWSGWFAHSTPTCPIPVTAAPGALADPSPVLTCGPTTFVGGFTSWADGAPANWDRVADYDVEYEDTNGVWQPLHVVLHGSGELRFGGPADPGNTVDIRLRGRGRHRQQVNGSWTPWSTWGAWSSWHTHTTPTCVTVPAPPTAPSPTNLAAACATVSSTLTAQATWAAPGNTATLQYRHTVTWVVTPTSGTSVTHTTGPHTTLSATITNLSHSLAAGDMVRIYVSTQARARTHISGSTYTAWSAWGTASAQAGPVQTSPGCPVPPPPPIPCSSNPALIAAVYPPGYAEPYTDYDYNGSWDSGEPFIDHNNDGTWTADIGGVLTGQCFPPGSICLQPGEVCLAMGS